MNGLIHKIYKYGFIVLLLFFIVSCTEQNSKPLKVSFCQWPGYESIYLAQQKDLIENVKISIDEALTSEETLKLFLNDRCDIAALTLDESVELAEMGGKFKILGVMDFSNGGDVVIAKPYIKDIKDLKGKTVALQTTTIGKYTLSLALNMHNMSINDVKLVYMPANEAAHTYKKESVDAVVTFFPYSLELEKAGGKIIYNSSETPYKLIDLLLVRTDILERRREDVANFVSGWQKAVSLIKAADKESVDIIASRERVTPEELLAAYEKIIIPSAKENIDFISGNPSRLQTTADEMILFMLSNKLISQEINFTGMIDPEFLKETNK